MIYGVKGVDTLKIKFNNNLGHKTGGYTEKTFLGGKIRWGYLSKKKITYNGLNTISN